MANPQISVSFCLAVKVNEYSLLPLMLEQFPFLCVSGPTLSKMWKQQITQVEQLRKDVCRENRSKKKLQDEVSHVAFGGRTINQKKSSSEDLANYISNLLAFVSP